jgi:hypothetical protein
LVEAATVLTDLLLAPCVCLLCVRVAFRGFGFFLQEVSGVFSLWQRIGGGGDRAD